MELNHQDRRFLSSMRIQTEEPPERFGDEDIRRIVNPPIFFCDDQPGTRIREVESPAPPSDRYLTVLIFVIGMLLAALTGFCIGMVAR
jgi:hypothetical protein